MMLRPAFDIADGTVNGPPFQIQVVRIEITLALVAAFDPALAAGQRDVERAAEHDVGDGVEAARRQILRAADEIAGRVVDETGQRAAVGPDLRRPCRRPLRRRGCRRRCLSPFDLVLSESAFAVSSSTALRAAADVDGRAELRVGLAHHFAQARCRRRSPGCVCPSGCRRETSDCPCLSSQIFCWCAVSACPAVAQKKGVAGLFLSCC